MRPPIRGGVYRKAVAPPTEPPSSCSDTDEPGASTAEDDGSDFSDHTSLTSECSSIANAADDEPAVRKRFVQRGHGSQDGAKAEVQQTPAEYLSMLEQNDDDQCIRDYPSVDPLVQQDIMHKYRQLHQQLRDEGLYECRYSEYGKEMIRYSMLFAAFIVALRSGWYITSAIFLGGFWVRTCYLLLQKADADADIGSSIKSCSRHTMPAVSGTPRYPIGLSILTSTRHCHHSQLCHRHPDRPLHCRLLLWSVYGMVEEQPQRPSPGDQPACM